MPEKRRTDACERHLLIRVNDTYAGVCRHMQTYADVKRHANTGKTNAFGEVLCVRRRAYAGLLHACKRDLLTHVKETYIRIHACSTDALNY